jgi:hypothetical protein
VHICYVDELKYKPDQGDEYYWLCGLAINELDFPSVERQLDAIAAKFFGRSAPSKDTEFHAPHIVQNKGPYKGRPIKDRVDLYCSLADTINNYPSIARIIVRLSPSKIGRDDYHTLALVFFLERLEQLMQSKKSHALMVCDEDEEIVASNVSSLASYKHAGTPFPFGIPINHIVDTIHHTKSHHSRLLQLADLYTYSLNLLSKKPTKWPKKPIADHLNGLKNFRWGTKYKYWP